ncbi:MAG: hypothetical protein R2705_17225 [Ilumatobacteraceae bacterium]
MAPVDPEQQIERLEAGFDLIDGDVEHGGDRTAVVVADREHLAVEVLALDLDHAEEALQHLERGTRQLAQFHQVEYDLGRGPEDLEVVTGVHLVAGQQLVDEDLVEAGEALEAGEPRWLARHARRRRAPRP